MTEQEKKIKMIDICARLSHGVKGKVETTDGNGKEIKDEGVLNSVFINEHGGAYICIEGMEYELEDVKLYLRPLSSMTEEEMGEYAKFKLSNDNDVYEFTDFRTTGKGFINVHTSCKNGGNGYTFQINNRTMLYDGVIGIDWLNKKHFDYRKTYYEKSGKWKTMIELGLALPAPNEMYNIK